MTLLPSGLSTWPATSGASHDDGQPFPLVDRRLGSTHMSDRLGIVGSSPLLSLPGTSRSQWLTSRGSSELHLCSIVASSTSILLIISVCLPAQLRWRLVSTTYHLTSLSPFFLLLLGMWLVGAHPSRLSTRDPSLILWHWAFLPLMLRLTNWSSEQRNKIATTNI